MRDLQLPGRSPVHSLNAMAATSHPAATLTALDILRAGGNAVDAAIAAAAVLGVVEPQSTGIGGDCFVLYVPGGEGEVLALNGSGRAPAAATADWYVDHDFTEIGFQSPHSVTVPGAIAAWQKLADDHGRFGLDRLLAPAIDFAEGGYPVHSVIANVWQREQPKLEAHAGAYRTFLPGGRAPRAGEVHRMPELAQSMRRIAEQGRDGFYTGPVAEDIVATLNELGGLHTLDDFAAAEVEMVTPISTDYGDYQVFECPPNGQGIIVLEMLNILSGFELARLAPLGVERLHLEAEATRLAFRDRAAFLADPAHAQVPVAHLLSEDYAAGLRALIRPDRAMPTMPAAGEVAHEDTVYLSIVDGDRNAIAFINSTFHSFGSGLVSADTGVCLHNRGASFVVEPGHPNCIAPGKRPMHTIIPGMLMNGKRAVMPFGVMGGHYQPVGQTHFLTNVLDFGMDLQEALDAPRAFAYQNVLQVERGIAPEVAEGLAALGHDVVPAPVPLGGGQAIWIDQDTGVLTAGSEPRKDGCALGY